jgi:heterodisulfide reductase subunit A2
MGCRIGVYVCNCGTNIAKTVNSDEIADAARQWPDVVVARSYKYVCSNPGQEMITQDIRDMDLDRIVVAACSPRMHEPTFRRALATGGINPYFLEMANIREQCSWVHDDPRLATDKALALTRAAVRRVALHEPLEKRHVDMNPATLVLGGGIAGLTAALELAMSDQPVFLVERAKHLGGNLARVDLTAPYLDSARDMLTDRITRVREHPGITVMLDSELDDLSGFVGNFVANVRTRGRGGQGTIRELPVGSVVVCTGYQPFDAAKVTAYGYGRLPDVITSFELEARLKEGRVLTSKGRPPRYAAIIHCVGSRSETYHPYCSRVCCMTALKFGHEIRATNPDCFIYDLYIDMHAFGKGMEDFYRRSAEMKTIFIMSHKNSQPEIRLASGLQDCNMVIKAHDVLCGEEVEIPSDLVVLMVGLEAREDAGKVARLVNISQDKDGWFIESHPKLDPVATTTDGIYIAGTCSSPKDIPDTVAQARAAVARILAKIARGKIEVDAVYAEIDEEHCSGCRMCNELCPYAAIEYDMTTKRSHVISALCKACGTCVAACPSGAIKGRHFTDAQIFAQIEGVL